MTSWRCGFPVSRVGPRSGSRVDPRAALRAGLCGLLLVCALGVLLAAPSPAAANPHLERQPSERPLSAADVERYAEIFALQTEGKWQAADRLIGALEDELLLGHVLAQRYLHPTHYKSRYQELAAWLERYADHPDADRIHRLALKRKPTGVAAPKRPVKRKHSLAAAAPLDVVHLYQSKKRLSRTERRKVRQLQRRIRQNIRRVYLTKTEQLLQEKRVRRLFDQYELDEAYSLLAAGWLYYGKPKKALEIAGAAAERTGDRIPVLHWTAGLAAWRLGEIATAARHFQALASSERASAWNRTAGAYWAARAHDRSHNIAEAHRWLTVAARFPHTFYGLLAQHRLGLQFDVRFAAPSLDHPNLARLRATAEGTRAIALIQVGQKQRAEQELLLLDDWTDPRTTRALLALTQSAALPRLGLEMAKRLLRSEASGWTERDLGGVLYPLPPWKPEKGFILDRALVYAFMRQESDFDPRAKSPSGARGLMQLMPRTASYLDKHRRYRGGLRDLLYDPQLNITLGQRYLERLLGNRRVDNDLLRLTVAYNAGPGNLRKWERSMDHRDDPLLYLESLPKLETRLFAERVLTNLWIYRLRLGQSTPSLQALASDRWPAYGALDQNPQQVASQP